MPSHGNRVLTTSKRSLLPFELKPVKPKGNRGGRRHVAAV